TKTATLTVQRGPALTKLALTPGTVAGCLDVQGKVTIDQPAPAGGSVVSLSTTNPAATVPASVTVASGQTTATFTITTTAVTSIKTGVVKAVLGTSSLSKPLKVRPIGVKSVSLTPNPVVGGNDVNGKVTLECEAAPGDIIVTLSSSAPGIANPTVSSLTI